MQMTRPQRLATLSGVVFFVLALIGRLAYPSAPGFVDAPAKIAAFYQRHDNGVLTANLAILIATIFLFAFAGRLRELLARHDDSTGLASAVFGAMAAGAALLIAGAAADMVAALRVQDQHTISAPIAATLWDVNHTLIALAAPVAFAAAALGTAAVAIRSRILPAWYGAATVVLGIALAIPPVSYIAMIVFLFWVLVTSLMLAVRPAPIVESALGMPLTRETQEA